MRGHSIIQIDVIIKIFAHYHAVEKPIIHNVVIFLPVRGNLKASLTISEQKYTHELNAVLTDSHTLGCTGSERQKLQRESIDPMESQNLSAFQKDPRFDGAATSSSGINTKLNQYDRYQSLERDKT